MTNSNHNSIPLTFRWSTPVDAETVHDIWSRAVVATHVFLSPEDFAAFSELVRTEYATHASLLLAESGGRVLGFMGMTENTIDSLFVEPDDFGRGVGRALVDQARTIGVPLRVDVNEQNAGARAFYERLGFVVLGRSEVDDHGRPYPLLHLGEQG